LDPKFDESLMKNIECMSQSEHIVNVVIIALSGYVMITGIIAILIGIIHFSQQSFV
jgi:hypothetical protein